MAGPLRFLVAESEPPEARDARRESVGRSSGETYVETLRSVAPSAICDRLTPSDRDGAIPSRTELGGYDAIFLTGSPLHLYEETDETRRQVEFMRAVFRSGTPSFGSCAGLQVATVAAGGKVRPGRRGAEAPFAHRITLTDQGRDHPLLSGRPPVFEAPSIHSDEVESLPDGATLLARNEVTEVQAAEIRLGDGVFWGVQYHPELSLGEVAAAVRRQSDSLVEKGAVPTHEALGEKADLIDKLDREPDRADLARRLGISGEVVDIGRRRLELRNFVEQLVRPVRTARGRE